jgi:transmembrane sensor
LEEGRVRRELGDVRGEGENGQSFDYRSGPMVNGQEVDKKVRRIWRRWVAAAAVIAMLFTGWYFIQQNNKPQVGVEPTAVTNDVQSPDKNRASIRLADGRVIYLDSSGNGQLASVNGMHLMKKGDGVIEYSGGASTSLSMEYHTLTNPRGSKVMHMTLSDGSKVWLNAGSSITYPVAFVGDERKVNINGEAYFEVAHNKEKPFYVSKGDVSVQVLGTHFNVNAYDDESEIKVTLLEGSVAVKSKVGSGESKVIKPGEQARVMSDQLSVMSNVNIEQVMAWKNGLFSFERADIKTIMREVARWYNVDVVYTKDINELFRLKTSRNTSVTNIFKILEATGKVHLKVEGRTITVQP